MPRDSAGEASMDTTTLGDLRAPRLLLGSNPFSGFSHQGKDRDERMVHHYTVARIKETLFEAERLGITGLVARTDFHVMRMLLEYRDDGTSSTGSAARPARGRGPRRACAAPRAVGRSRATSAGASWIT